jgi:hypothetical protein
MLIDKSKFVALVGAIATSTACLIVSDDDDRKRGDDDDGGDTTSATSSASTSGTGSSTSSASSGDTSSSASSGGGACLADEGTPGACTGECEGFSTCPAVDAVSPGVGEDLVPCLNGLDPLTCSVFTDARATCLFDSLAKACDDPAASSLCTEIAAGCAYTDDATWQDLCMSRLNGLVPGTRASVVSCTKESCAFSDTALDDCLVNVFYPTQ